MKKVILLSLIALLANFVNAQITVNVSPNQIRICKGDSTQLSAVPSNGTAPYTYLWASNPAGFSSTLANPTFAPIINTTYTVTVTDASLATATGSMSVVINPLPTVMASSSSICYGSTTIISASGDAIFYIWSNGMGSGSSQMIYPTISSTYTVTGINGNACQNTAQAIVTVNPLPTVNAGLAVKICQDDSYQIMSLQTNANIPVYLWSAPPGTYISQTNIPNPTVSYSTPGIPSSDVLKTFNVTVTDGNTSCSSSSSIDVTFEYQCRPLATAFSSLSNICIGTTSIISAKVQSSHPYLIQWSDPTFGSGLGPFTVAPTTTTTYTITATRLDDPTKFSMSSAAVTVNSLPATPVISQAHDTLVSNAPAGNQWYMTSGSILNATNSFYIPQATDNYYTIVTNDNGCSSHKSNVISFIYGLGGVDTLYAPLDNAQQIKDSIILSAKDSCLFDYTQPMDTFYIASAQIIGSQMQFNWVFKQGVKTYHVVSEVEINKVSNGYDLIYITILCNETKKKGSLHSTTFVAPYYISLVSVRNITQSPVSINLYPNPAIDKFTIEMDNLKEMYNLEILNTIGQLVLNKQITNPVEQVDLSNQAAGIYFVKLQSANNTIVRKIIKQK